MIALLLVAVLVLVLVNAFFVAAEFALVRSRKAHLQRDADVGRRGAATAVGMMDDLSRYLSAAQVGITLTSLGLGFLGEPSIGRLIKDLFGPGVPHWVSDGRLDHGRLPDHHGDPHHARRAGPEDLRDPAGGGRRPRGRRPAAAVLEAVPPVHRAAEQRLERDPAADRRPHVRPAR